MSRRMVLISVGVAGCLVAGPATTALAADSPSPGATVPLKSKRVERLCKREPRVAARVTKLIARFSGDASTRGSVAWVQARANQVRAKDPQLAGILDDRAKIRQSRIATLKLRQDELTKVAQWCTGHGHPVGSPSPSPTASS